MLKNLKIKRKMLPKKIFFLRFGGIEFIVKNTINHIIELRYLQNIKLLNRYWGLLSCFDVISKYQIFQNIYKFDNRLEKLKTECLGALQRSDPTYSKRMD
jgi:hypothetical protein